MIIILLMSSRLFSVQMRDYSMPFPGHQFLAVAFR